ncbi:TRAP transporter substrate-binding protein [Aquabacterium sp. CECT 9606]|uniref:TRAP transporter substrate-binding protein n=1 Tax=Aquabacterium sp. CECT 9606 TaxID=2845822 RepID=UPI001E3891D9|nr:TRAP transporter substrate-binding protein [Aquabacterium sp. CECT 9606]CAH0355799.1 C4-dicarboxylate-binding periplasmic protein DctP [Aquabacterium sp. CECT 9606]
MTQSFAGKILRRHFLAAAAAIALVPSAFAQAPIVIKFSHVVAMDTPKGKAATFFAKRAEELTKGRVKVEVYPNSQLYKDKEELEALQLGSVQMLAPSLSKFAPLGVKEFEVFDLPFIFDDYADLHRVTEGPVGKGLLAKLETRGITGLAYWDNGFKVFSANKPLKAVADYKGTKMRIQSSKVLDAEMRALGALPQVLAFSETYQALQTGVVDGTENPPSNLYTQKMYEVQKHLSVTNHGYLGYAVVVNKKFWDGLPTDIRGQLTQAITEATKVANDHAFADNQEALAKVKAAGKTEIYTPTPAERLALKKALVPVHQQMTSRIGEETLRAIYKETGFDPSKL